MKREITIYRLGKDFFGFLFIGLILLIIGLVGALEVSYIKTIDYFGALFLLAPDFIMISIGVAIILANIEIKEYKVKAEEIE